MAGTSVTFQERRRAERHLTRAVTGTLRLSTAARILNLSMTGMAVQSDVPFPVGRTYSITLRYAAGLALRLAGSVVWCLPREAASAGVAGTRAVHEAGLRFDHTLGRRASDLARVLQTVARTEVTRRASGRFKVEWEEPVTLETTLEFAARNVSAVGMLVETDGLPPPESVVDAELRVREHVLRTTGRVTRTQGGRGARGERLRLVGVDFVDDSQGGREAIRRFIDLCFEQAAGEAAV